MLMLLIASCVIWKFWSENFTIFNSTD
jgi:hypothetical protein